MRFVQWGIHRVLLLLLSAGISLTGCAQILGVDEYSKARNAAHDGGAMDAAADKVIDPLFDSKPPYLSGPGCIACIDEHCHVEDRACADDAFCSKWVEDARQRTEPLIVAHDLLARNDDARWDSDHGIASGWKERVAFETCALNRCLAACDFERDFSCVGKFDWPESFPQKTDFRFRVVQGANPALGRDGWKVRACAPQSACELPLGQATTQDGGFATLEIDFSMARESWPGTLSEFDGFLRIDGGDNFFPWQLHQSQPFLHRAYRSDRSTGTRDELLASLKALGVALDGEPGMLAFLPYDCAYARGAEMRAKGVTIDLWKVDIRGIQPCGECLVRYPNDNGVLDVTVTDYSSRSGFPAQTLVPPGDFMIVVRDTKTRLPISVLRHVTVRAGYVQYFFMYPASRKQLAELPKEAR